MTSFTEYAFVIAVISVISFISYFKWAYGYWKRRNVVQIKPSIPMGILENPLFMKKGFYGILNDAYYELKAKGEKFGGLYFLHKPVFLPIDRDLIKNMLTKDFQHFVNHGNFVDEKTDPLSANLLSLEDDKWKNLRTKLTPTFTSGKMKNMFQTMVVCGDQLKDHIRSLVTENKTLDIKEIISCYTTDIIGSCAFGVDCNSFKNPDAEFRKYGRKLVEVDFMGTIRLALLFLVPELNKLLKIRIFRKDVERFFVSALTEVIDRRNTTDFKRNDFIQLLLQVGKSPHGGNSNESLTTNEMIAQAFIFFLGGFETSSTNLQFCLHELAFHQDIQQDLRNEIITVIERHGGQLSYEGLMEMAYMDQVVNESLRKYPPVPFLNRKCSKTYAIPATNVVIEKNTSVLINVLGMHMDPDYFPNPEKFDPERFSKENKSKIHPFTFLPFGDGPRVCIGMRFANMQIKIALASILSNFKIRPYKTTSVRIEYNPRALLLVPKRPILLSAQSL